MGAAEDIIKELKETAWEEKSQLTIDSFRLMVAGVKFKSPSARLLMMGFLRQELEKHASDDLAKRLFNHYLGGGGKDFTLTLGDMVHMNSDERVRGHIDIRTTEFGSPNPAFESACTSAKAGRGIQDYSGRLHWIWDNGAISTYTVIYAGRIKLINNVCQWKGGVEFFDRFDLDPRWGWSESNKQGRSRGGERRTRIGYILALGSDFDIKSPQASVVQQETDTEISFDGASSPGGAQIGTVKEAG